MYGSEFHAFGKFLTRVLTNILDNAMKIFSASENWVIVNFELLLIAITKRSGNI